MEPCGHLPEPTNNSAVLESKPVALSRVNCHYTGVVADSLTPNGIYRPLPP